MQLSPIELLQELELCSDISGACFSSMTPVYEACNINIEELCANQCIQDFERDPSNINATIRIITDCAGVCNKIYEYAKYNVLS